MKKKLLSLMVALLAITAFAATMSLTMTRRAPVTELTVISEATTWDFSKLTANTSSEYYASEGIKLTDASTPTKNDEFIYANYLTTFFTADASFKADAIAFKGEYPIRKDKYSQNGILHFKTSVAGKIVVSFNDTGSSPSATAVKRYLVVNGTQTEYWTSRENNGDTPYEANLNVESGEIAVPAGDVTITGSSAIQVSKIVFTPDAGGSGDDPFKTKVDAALAAPVAGVATLTLDADYTVKSAINVPLGTQLVIDGAGHTLTLGESTNFVINDNITLKDVKIDATALTSPLIALTATPAEGTKKNQDVYTDAAATDFNLLNAVTVENVMVKNLKAEFISNSGIEWALENFTLTKSIIQLDATGKNFIAFHSAANNKSAIKNITISENTIYNINETSNAYFIRYANASNAAKAFGTNNGTSTFDYKLTKNTIINTFKAQNFGNNTPNNGKVTMEVTQNIFADVKNISKFVQGNCTKTVEKNVGWGEGQEASISDAVSAVFTVPTAALDLTAENGGIDLKAGASTLAAKYEAGDPRWAVTYVEPASMYVFGDITENGWNSITTKMTFNAQTQAYEYDFVATKDVWFAFSDTEFAATEDNWDAVNAARYSLGDAEPTIGTAQDLVKGVDRSIKLPAGTWKASISEDKTKLTITGEAAPEPEPTYVVAGNLVSLFGAEWDGSAEANKMTKNETTGLYEITYSNVTLEAGTIEYKIVKNGSTWIPDGMGNNQTVTIPSAGTYNVTFTFNPETNEITGAATDATGINGITVDGVSGDIFSDGKPVYNLSGQRVFKGYKGIVIKNGRKIVVK